MGALHLEEKRKNFLKFLVTGLTNPAWRFLPPKLLSAESSTPWGFRPEQQDTGDTDFNTTFQVIIFALIYSFI
jgi:hypothetical protein